MKFKKFLSGMIALAGLTGILSVQTAIASTDNEKMEIQSVVYPIDDTEKTSLKFELSNIAQAGTLVAALYKSETEALSVFKTTPVTTAEEAYTVNFDAADLSGAAYVKAFVWDSLSGMLPLSTTIKTNISDIETETKPDEAVVFNYSDEFLYRFGTKGATVPLDVTYTVDGVESAITSDNVVFETEVVLGNTETTTANITVSNGTPSMTLTGGGQVKLIAYPANYADDETKKVSFTFEVLEDFYNVSSANKTGLSSNFCLVEDLTNAVFAVNAGKTGYGNDYTVDNKTYTSTSKNAGLITIYSDAKLDNIRVIGHPGTELVFSSNATDNMDTWSTVLLYGNATLTNSYVQYGQHGVNAVGSGNVVENVTIHNAVRSVNLNGGATVDLNNITIDQYRTEKDIALGQGIGGGIIVAEATTPATININGNIHFHTFVTEDDIQDMSSNVQSYVKDLFTNEQFVFTKDGTQYINPAIITIGSELVLNISEDSNFAGRSKASKTVSLVKGEVYTYNNTNVTYDNSAYLWESPVYAYSAGFDHVPYTKTLPNVEPITIENNSITVDYAEGVSFRKYATNLDYSVSATNEDGTELSNGEAVWNNNGTVTFNTSEAKKYKLVYSVTDKFDNNKIYTHSVDVSAVPPETRTPIIVFAAPSGVGTGDVNNPFVVKGYKATFGNYDVDINTSYGVKAFDYEGNEITDFTLTLVDKSQHNKSDTASAGGTISSSYFSTNWGSLEDETHFVTIKYTVTDTYNNTTSATRYYQISSFEKSFLGTKNKFESRNGLGTIAIAWNGEWNDDGTIKGMTVTDNNYVTYGGEVVQ